MKLHVRAQGKTGFSFRLRVLERYIDAGESYATEEEAAFAADLVKHLFREFYFIDLKRSMDVELWAFECYRQNVDWSDRLAVEKFLPPGIKTFLLDHRDALDNYAEVNRPEVKPWETLRKHPQFYNNGELHEWVIKCEAAELEAEEFSVIDHRSFITRFEVARNALETALRSLRVAQRMHSGATNEKLVERSRLLNELLTHLEATEAHVRFLSAQFAAEQLAVEVALSILESNRPPLV